MARRRKSHSGRGGGRRRDGGARSRRSQDEYDDYADAYDEEREDAWDEEEEDEAGGYDEPARPRPRTSRGRRHATPKAGPRKKRGLLGLFGSRGDGRVRGSRRRGLDWDRLEEEEFYDEDESIEDDAYDDGPPGRPPRRGKRVTLMELCTPVFGAQLVLPQAAGGVQPGYEQFRNEIVAGLQRIETEAAEQGIMAEDAQEACYALAVFTDAMVHQSEWTAKSRWLSEPLGVVMFQDPDAGVNFFERLDRLGERQRHVQAVYLVCLALGFRGRYMELDAATQATEINKRREELIRAIHPTGMHEQELLFPQGYSEAAPVEDQVAPPPRWWIAASISLVVLSFVIYLVLFWQAGEQPKKAIEALGRLVSISARGDADIAAGPAFNPRGGDRS